MTKKTNISVKEFLDILSQDQLAASLARLFAFEIAYVIQEGVEKTKLQAESFFKTRPDLRRSITNPGTSIIEFFAE
jgi:hypothetical protein